MFVELLIFLVTTFIFFLWYNYKKVEWFYAEKNVRYKPEWPILGNSLMSTLQKKHVFYDVDRIYKAFPNDRYVGYVDSSKPAILIRDPELIKMITVKDFDHFTDHKDFFSEHIEPLFGSSLFSMKGEKWRDMRTILSPAFTGSKMKHMMQFMIDISMNTVEYLKEHQNENIDVDDVVRRYTNDVIASTNFGLEVNSYKHRTNEFFNIGQSVLDFAPMQLFVMFLDDIFPALTKKLGIKVYPESTYSFFRDTIMSTVEYRKKNNISRPDMLQLLMETPKEWTPDELSSQAFIFFAAGFETSASVVVLTLHELTVNLDIQERLYQEIRTYKDENEKLTSDGISSLKYLDCVLNETLRKWSPALILDRKCTKTYVLPPATEGGKPCTLNPGDVVFNSANSVHLDPEHWPEPLKYDPDRWSDENKHKIKPFTFQPFGLGPRICIGSRFAILEAKILLYNLILNFKLLKCEKTTDPVELVDHGFQIKALGGTWIRFEERTKSGIKIYPESTYSFFRDTIMSTVEYRKKNNISRPDILQLLMETPKEWTPDELSAQAFIFFAAGFETFILNPAWRNIQNGGQVIFNQGFSTNRSLETLRKWSPALRLDRECTKTYVLPPASEGGKPCVLKPGDVVFNSANSIHLDPEYWPLPLKYDPDRWSEENKHKIKPFTFLPFGLGPRICIGSRFAILEAKVLLYNLILNFKLLKCEKTSDPMELITHGFSIKVIGGTWIRFEERTST